MDVDRSATADDAPAAEVARSAPPSSPSTPPPSHTAGVIHRAELERVLAQSPGTFLSHVDPAPTFHEHTFSGWRINSFFPGDPRFSGVDLRTGDIVTRINGRPIEQPEQFIKVWENARYRRDLTVEIVRDGVAYTLSWTIAD